MQKLYCYVDETGQDAGSNHFWVTVAVDDGDQDALRSELEETEKSAGTGRKKWNRVRPKNRLAYLSRVLERELPKGGVFVGRYRKPLPYAFPTIETVLRAVKQRATEDSQVIVIIDGLDKLSCQKHTNALRGSGVRSARVIGRRDESEPVLRLADMWAGAARAAFEKAPDFVELVEDAKKAGYLIELT
jgi:hypothetical protein